MKGKFDLDYEPVEESNESFAEQVKKEFLLSQDQPHQKLLKQKEEQLKKEKELNKKNKLLQKIKKNIIENAKKGNSELWFNMNQERDYWNKNSNNELSNDLDGMNVRWVCDSGTCGGHGYNSYEDFYYHVKW